MIDVSLKSNINHSYSQSIHSKTKGIGPLEPGETATWSFDNMFYDKNDVISRAKLTKITFFFLSL